MNQLTDRQRRILEYMQETIRTKGYPPTVRETCAAIGIKSTSTAHKDIESLVRQGYLRKDPAKPRALMVVDPAAGRAGRGSETTQTAMPETEKRMPQTALREDGTERIDVVDIPVIGQVAAGVPITAEQNIEGYFPIAAQYIRGGTHFMLRVKGESMIEAGIMDGDLILVEEQETAENGQIVVAMIDGFETEATVKTFYNEGTHIRLQPENQAMSPILVKDVKIRGRVKGVFRYFN